MAGRSLVFIYESIELSHVFDKNEVKEIRNFILGERLIQSEVELMLHSHCALINVKHCFPICCKLPFCYFFKKENLTVF